MIVNPPPSWPTHWWRRTNSHMSTTDVGCRPTPEKSVVRCASRALARPPHTPPTTDPRFPSAAPTPPPVMVAKRGVPPPTKGVPTGGQPPRPEPTRERWPPEAAAAGRRPEARPTSPRSAPNNEGRGRPVLSGRRGGEARASASERPPLPPFPENGRRREPAPLTCRGVWDAQARPTGPRSPRHWMGRGGPPLRPPRRGGARPRDPLAPAHHLSMEGKGARPFEAAAAGGARRRVPPRPRSLAGGPGRGGPAA